MSKEWADANPETFSKIIVALNEAIDFVNANPNEAKQCMKPYLPDVFKPHVDLYPDAYYLRTDESSEDVFQNLADQYLEMGIIPKKLDLKGLVVTKKGS